MVYKLNIPQNFPEIALESISAWTSARAPIFGAGKNDYSWVLNDPGAIHLLGIIFWLNRKGLIKIPTEVIALLAQTYYQNQARWLSWQESLSNVLQRLSESGISWMPLKGLALQPYIYPEPGMRWIGDVDLLVKPDSFLHACYVLGRLGFHPSHKYKDSLKGFEKHSDVDLPAEIEFQGAKGLIIDLHSRLNNDPWSRDLYCMDNGDIWSRSKVHGPFAKLGGREMLPEDTLAYLCFHLGKHGMGARSFHSFIDVDLWLRSFGKRLDWERFVKRVREWRIRPMAWFVMHICQRFLRSLDGQLKPRNLFDDKLLMQEIAPGYLMRHWISFWIEPEMLFFHQRWRREYRPTLVSFLMAEPAPGTIKVITQMVLPSVKWRYEHYGSPVSLIEHWRYILRFVFHL